MERRVGVCGSEIRDPCALKHGGLSKRKKANTQAQTANHSPCLPASQATQLFASEGIAGASSCPARRVVGAQRWLWACPDTLQVSLPGVCQDALNLCMGLSPGGKEHFYSWGWAGGPMRLSTHQAVPQSLPCTVRFGHCRIRPIKATFLVRIMKGPQARCTHRSRPAPPRGAALSAPTHAGGWRAGEKQLAWWCSLILTGEAAVTWRHSFFPQLLVSWCSFMPPLPQSGRSNFLEIQEIPRVRPARVTAGQVSHDLQASPWSRSCMRVTLRGLWQQPPSLHGGCCL